MAPGMPQPGSPTPGAPSPSFLPASGLPAGNAPPVDGPEAALDYLEEAMGDQEEPEHNPAGLPAQARSLADFNVKMDEDERLLLGRYLREEIDRYHDDTQQRRTMALQWRRDFEMMPVATSRWKGASEVCSPLSHIYCKSHKTKLDTQLTTVDPFCAVIARKPEVVDAAPQIEEALAAELEEADWKQTANRIHGELPLMGNVFVRTTYEETWRRKPEVKAEWDPQVMKALLQAGVSPEQAFLESVKTDSKGLPKVSLEWVNELRDAGPRFKVIPWEDGVILPSSIRTPEQARGIGERMMIAGHELKAGARQGKYIEDEVEQLLARLSDPSPDDRNERLDHQGIDADPETEPADGSTENPLFRWYECYELCWQMDANNDGWEEWVVVTLHYQSGRILRLQYMSYEHGEPYYKLLRYIERANELWGLSLSELVAGIQDAHTALLNQLVDSGDLVLNKRGSYWYDKESFDPSKWTFEMNRPIPVEDVNGIKEMTTAPLSPEHYAMLDQLKGLGDLLTATSNPSLGKTTDTTKTLGEVNLVNATSNLIFEEIANGVALQEATIWDQFRYLLAQFGEDNQVTYHKTAQASAAILTPQQAQAGDVQLQSDPMAMGQPMPPHQSSFGVIDADLLRANVRLVPTGLKQVGDANSRLQQAMLVLQTLMAIPLTGGNVQVVITLVDFFLQAARFPQREKILDAILQMVGTTEAQQQVMSLLMAAAAVGQGQVQGNEQAHQANQGDASFIQQMLASLGVNAPGGAGGMAPGGAPPQPGGAPMGLPGLSPQGAPVGPAMPGGMPGAPSAGPPGATAPGGPMAAMAGGSGAASGGAAAPGPLVLEHP